MVKPVYMKKKPKTLLRSKNNKNNGDKMSRTLKKYQRDIRCPRCGYWWNYKGRAEYYITCPNCRYAIKIKEPSVFPAQKELRELLRR